MSSGPSITAHLRPPLTFHDAYLSVVYGLVATNGLGQVVDLNSKAEWTYIPPHLALYVGMFVLTLHFWFTCSSVEKDSAKFYEELMGPTGQRFLLLMDALIATGLAGIVLTMFSDAPKNLRAVFGWFLVAAIASLAYDLYSRALITVAQRRCGAANAVVMAYKQDVGSWFAQDGLFLLFSLALWRVAANNYGDVLEWGMLTTALIVLALDVWPFNR